MKDSNSMNAGGPDAITQLIGALRQELANKKERIAWLEARLQEAIAGGEALAGRLDVLSQQVAGLTEAVARQHELLEAMAARSMMPATERVPASSGEAAAADSVEQLAAPPTGPLGEEAPEAQAQASASAAEAAAHTPDLSEAIQVIASTVVQAAQRKAAEESKAPEGAQDENEITARFSRKDLQKGHRGQGAKRGIWPFRQRSDSSA
jgi:hypothetical protein